MKKLICALLAVMMLLSLTACGGGTKTEEKNVPAPNMTDVFASMHAQLPSDAVAFSSEYVFDAYGVKAEDCKQQVVLSYYDGTVTAEIWMIEAVNKTALKEIKKLAEARLDSMKDQFQSYDQNAYALTKKAKLFTEGDCLVFFVSENVDQLMEIYKSAER